MSRIVLICVPLLTVLLCAISLSAYGKDTGLSPPIYDVRKLSMQRCSPAMIAFDTHPDRETIYDTGILAIANTGFSLNFRMISRYKEWTAMERLHDGARGIDDNYVLLTPNGLAPFLAAYVVSPIPDGISSASAMLESALSFQDQQANGHKISVIRVASRFGDGYEVLVDNRIGSTCFPTSDYIYAAAPMAALSITRLFVHSGSLLEFTITLNWETGLSRDEMIKLAQRRVDELMLALQVVDPEQSVP